MARLAGSARLEPAAAFVRPHSGDFHAGGQVRFFFFYDLFPGLKLWENSSAVVKPEGQQHPQTRAGTPAGTCGPPGVLGRPPWPLAKEGALLGQPMLLGQTSTLGSHEN